MRIGTAIAGALVLVLIAAVPALAGGWATVGLSSTPAGAEPGKPWNVDITVLQHGTTPVDGITPFVKIVSSAGVTKDFAAMTTDKPGVYRASVVFPTAGRWTYEVDDGFMGQRHSYPAVTVAAAPAAPAATSASEGGSGIAAGWLWGTGVALLLALAVIAVDRRRHAPDVLPQTPEPAA